MVYVGEGASWKRHMGEGLKLLKKPSCDIERSQRSNNKIFAQKYLVTLFPR